MKAALLKQIGNINELYKNLIVEDVPITQITDDDVLINLKFASLNRRDLYILTGLYPKLNLPVVLGSDGSGVIHSRGKNVSDFEIGDEVLINPGMNWGSDENFQYKDFKILGMPDNGTFAEYVCINKSYVYKKPEHLSFEQASALPLAGITAYRSLFIKANVTKDDNVLITGTGGGVAALALVFAINAGANVFVTSGSEDKISKAVSIGAKGGVNYKAQNWDKEISKLMENKINVIIDGTGGDQFSKLTEICSYGCRIVSYGASLGNVKSLPMARVFWKQLKILGSTMGSSEDFSEMMKFLNENKVAPVIDKIFRLDDICDAFKRMSDSEQFGKIVIGIQ